MRNFISSRFLVLFVSGIFLYGLWLLYVDLPRVLQRLTLAKIFSVAPVFLCVLAVSALKSLRLKVLIQTIAPLSFSAAFRLHVAGSAIAYFFPPRFGFISLAQAYYVHKRRDVSLAKMLSLFILPQAADLLALAAVLFLTPFLPVELPDKMESFFSVTALVLFGVMGLAYMGVSSRGVFMTTLEKILAAKQKKANKSVITFVHEFLDTLGKAAGDAGMRYRVMGLTFLTLVPQALAIVFAFRIFGSSISIIQAFLGTAYITFIHLLLSLPADLGIQEWAHLLILHLGMHASRETVAAVSWVMHMVSIAFLVFLGPLCLFSLRFRVGEAAELSERVNDSRTKRE